MIFDAGLFWIRKTHSFARITEFNLLDVLTTKIILKH